MTRSRNKFRYSIFRLTRSCLAECCIIIIPNRGAAADDNDTIIMPYIYVYKSAKIKFSRESEHFCRNASKGGEHKEKIREDNII